MMNQRPSSVDWKLNKYMTFKHEMLPPDNSVPWRLCLGSSATRDGTQRCEVEAVIDLLRGLVDTGTLQPDDVLRDVVLLNGQWRVRFWRRAR